MSIAIHELAVNAIEHGPLGIGGGRLNLVWRVSPDPVGSLDFVWRESHGAPLARPDFRGFGTEVLTRMLPYELEADAHLTFESDGVQFRALIPLSESTGRGL